MKVMCIANKWGWRRRQPYTKTKTFLWGLYKKQEESFIANGPDYGEICTVIDKTEDSKWYYLKEYFKDERGETINYEAKCFIPLSEIDERERINEKSETS